MSINIDSLPSIVDIAAVTANTTSSDIASACSIANAYGCASVIVNPCFLMDAARQVSKPVMHGVTLSFPLGSDLTAVKLYAAQQSSLSGADEIDMVMNIGAFLSGNTDLVHREVALVKSNLDVPLKVIIEAPLLSNEQIAEAAEIAADAGADWIKTGTGMNGPATASQVQIIRETVGDRAKIKAAGGIRTIADMISLCEAGASRLGISAPSALTIFREIDRNIGRESPQIDT